MGPLLLTPTLLAIAASVLLNMCSLGLCSSEERDNVVVFSNGRIFTADPHHPVAQAMAVRNGRITFIGSDQSAKEHSGDAVSVDLERNFVVPGLIDSHVHFINGGLQLRQLDLRNLRTVDAFKAAVAVAASSVDVKEGEWLLGWGWNEANWEGQQLPTKEWIDDAIRQSVHVAVCSGEVSDCSSPLVDGLSLPVWLERIDGHMGLANTAAMVRAGLIDDSGAQLPIPDPPGGEFLQDASGNFTGCMVDTAMNRVSEVIPLPSIRQRREALRLAMVHALQHGVTAVVDFGDYAPGGTTETVWRDLDDVYEWMDEAGAMRVRVHAATPLLTWRRMAARVAERGYASSSFLRWGILKAFADGSLGSHSALFHQPYADSANWTGLQLLDFDWLAEAAAGADEAGLQVAVHAIGDAANDGVIGAYEKVTSGNGWKDRRFRIEHAQHLSPEAPSRMATLGLVASMQPPHLLDDVKVLERRLGRERALNSSYLFQELLQHFHGPEAFRRSGKLVFGSDWTVAPLNPVLGVAAAIGWRPADWVASFDWSQNISAVHALLAFTRDAAFGSFQENDIGSLSVGKFADFVILKGEFDSQSMAEGRWPSVNATYVGGVMAYPTQSAMSDPNICTISQYLCSMVK